MKYKRLIDAVFCIAGGPSPASTMQSIGYGSAHVKRSSHEPRTA